MSWLDVKLIFFRLGFFKGCSLSTGGLGLWELQVGSLMSRGLIGI